MGQHVPASFFLPIADDDDDSADPASGDTLPVDSHTESSGPSTGTEESNVPVPTDAALLALQQARVFFEENTGEFPVHNVSQLTRMLDSLYEQQARIAMRRNVPCVPEDGAENQNRGLAFMCDVVLNSV